MNILALDASGKTAGICLTQNGKQLYSKTLCEGLTHSETLLPLVQQGLAACGLTVAQIDLYAITNGPGSFTGLRIGIALIKGLAMVHNTPVVGVSTLHALAAGCTLNGTIVAALDARRGEVYWAAFKRENGHLTRLTPDTAGPVEQIAEYGFFSNSPVFFIGDGAKICYTSFKLCSGIQNAPPAASLGIAQGAAFLAENRTAEQEKNTSASQLVPVYLRLSQAERERKARLLAATPPVPDTLLY